MMLGPEEEILSLLTDVRKSMQGPNKCKQSSLLDALVAMIECGPDICESFFTNLADESDAVRIVPCPEKPLWRGQQGPSLGHQQQLQTSANNLFDVCVDMLSEASAPIASQLASVLVAVVHEVGLSTSTLRRMIGNLFEPNNGTWSKNAQVLLQCITSMMQPRISATERRRARHPLHFFVMDGASSGLYLGGDASWVWPEGYTFAAWIWKNGNEQGDMLLFHLVGGETEGQATNIVQLIIRTDKKVARLVVLVGDGARMCEVDTKLVVCASTWTQVAVSHEYNKVKTSVLTTWLDDAKHVADVRYPAVQANVRAYAACAGNSLVRNFKGLLGTVHVWTKAISYAHIAAAQSLGAAAMRQGRERAAEAKDADYPRPHFSAEPGSVVFPPGICCSRHVGAKECGSTNLSGTQCTCFTISKVRILTPEELRRGAREPSGSGSGAKSACAPDSEFARGWRA